MTPERRLYLVTTVPCDIGALYWLFTSRGALLPILLVVWLTCVELAWLERMGQRR
jgi:hypothetical protein